MIFHGSSKPMAFVATSLSTIGLGGCDASATLEMRCAAFFHQLSNVDVGPPRPERSTIYRQHALAFIDRLPGNRADNIAAMYKVGDSIMAYDGLREQCDRIIPLQDNSLESE